MTNPIVIGTPEGISTSGTGNNLLRPDFAIWSPDGLPKQLPLAHTIEIGSVAATRTLPNGTKIDKFRGYDSPVVYPREVWRWSTHNAIQDPTTVDRFTAITNFGQTFCYIFRLVYLGDGDVYLRYRAEARFERWSINYDPQYSAQYAANTAEFERLSTYTYVTTVASI